MFEGRGPLAILLLVLRRRPRAEPDAVRAADDSDQPGDHRRRRAGRIARPRLPARLGLRRRDGARLRRRSAWSSSSPPAPSARSTRRRGSTSASRSCSSCSAWRCSTSSLIDFSEYSSTLRGSGEPRQRSLLAFSMGAVAALLAGACVAPVVIQVVLFSSNLYATGTQDRAGAAVLPRHRHGDSVADRRRRARGAAEARHVDGARQAGVRRLHPGHGACTTATRRIRLFANRWVDPAAVASSVKEQLKAGWHASLADGLDRRAARAEAGADRHVGHLVQELPDHGQDDAGKRGRQERAVGLHQDQVPGGRPGRGAGSWMCCSASRPPGSPRTRF